MADVSEPIAVTLLVIDALESLRIPYVIGGSLASALHGVARATLDSDLVVDLQPDHVQPLVQAQIRNAQTVTIATNPERAARFTSPEDTILAKLRWYRLGGDSSERQWRDVTGIVAAQAARLDWPYLQRRAAELDVTDLLARLQEGL